MFNYPFCQTAFVTLNVYNIAGQLVKTLIRKQLAGGRHNYHWDATQLTSGLYFYQLQAGGHTFTRKAILVK